MIGHLGDRVSALLDGQLPPAEEERAWSHVHACHQCRDLVEREGWVKTRLAGLSFGAECAPSSFKESLLASVAAGLPPGEAYLHSSPDPRPRRASLVALGGGAAGAAVMGVLALGAAPADAPTLQRPAPPTTSFTNAPSTALIAHHRRAPSLP
jgi:anti-sigma factor RsiW